MPGEPRRASLPDLTTLGWTPARIGWLDVGAGVSGDMLLGAFVDAGVPLTRLQAAVDAVIPAAVHFSGELTKRAGMRALAVRVLSTEPDPPHRAWSDIDARLAAADMNSSVRDLARAAFRRLAEAEAAIHGSTVGEVHFHEVGAWDSIADIVGVCAAYVELGLTALYCGPVELGSGEVNGAHGTMPVPAPAALALAVGWQVTARLDQECATPTGLTLLRTLVERQDTMPPLTISAVGVGAGGRDPHERANVVRLVVGDAEAWPASARMRQLEANVDDLDPRVWPEVLTALLAAGAADAWLTPIQMKKGRPAHTLSVLARPEAVDELVNTMMTQTSTLGVRVVDVQRRALARTWVDVDVAGHLVAVKIGHDGRRIRNVAVEFDSVIEVAHALTQPVTDVLRAAETACGASGFVAGALLPPASASRPGPQRSPGSS